MNTTHFSTVIGVVSKLVGHVLCEGNGVAVSDNVCTGGLVSMIKVSDGVTPLKLTLWDRSCGTFMSPAQRT